MRFSLLVATAILSTGIAAHADTVFNASGAFSDGSLLTGTVTINTTTGSVTAADLVVSGASNFTFVNVVGNDPHRFSTEYFVGVRNAAGTEDFNFDLPNSPSGNPLIGYVGGPMCSNAAPCPYDSNLYNLATNSASPALLNGALAATPEPSSILLLGTGLLAAAGTLKRRFARA